jgi:hypothetical protein
LEDIQIQYGYWRLTYTTPAQQIGSFDTPVEFIEVHQQVIVTVENSPPSPPTSPPQDTPRHIAEKKRLLERMHRKHGTWNTNHPRWRLLDALWGYQAYQEQQGKEVTRLRGLYDRVSKEQKAVCIMMKHPLGGEETDRCAIDVGEAYQLIGQIHKSR